MSSKRNRSSSTGSAPKKRLKAKVGKRATTKNETDTDFKAVSVQVSHQRISVEQSLQELLPKASHPSAVVRKSCLQTMLQQNLLQENSVSSLWIPVVTKCASVDEDESVRRVGFQILQQDCLEISPHHLSIILAYVSSAMVHLNVDIRFHGCKLLTLFCTNNNHVLRDQQCVFLPLFPRLLRDASSVTKSDYNKTNKYGEKSKKKKSTLEDRLSIVLEALVAFLKASFPKQKALAEMRESSPIEFRTASSDGVFVAPSRAVSTKETPIQSMSDFCNMLQQQSVEKKNRDLPFATDFVSILERLCDVLIELQQQSNTSSPSQLLLVLESVRILWKQIVTLEKLSGRLLKLLLELYNPIHEGNSASVAILQVNTLLVCLLVELGRDQNSNKDWMHPVVSFCTSTTQNSSSFEAIETLLGDWNPNDNENDDNDDTTSSSAMCHKVFQSVCDLYFSHDQETTVDPLSSRKAVKLVLGIITRYNDSNDNVNEKSRKRFIALTRNVIIGLPKYIATWDTSYLDDSTVVWKFLLDTIRKHDLTEKEKSTIMTKDLMQILSTDTSRCLFKGTKKKQPILFVRYPEHIQRIVVAFLGTLIKSHHEGIADTIVRGLAKSCQPQATTLSPMICDYVFDVMHTVRRCVSMQTYLEFVMDSVTIKGTKKDDNPDECISCQAIMKHDESFKRACRALVECGSASKVLMALDEVLLSWISNTESSCLDSIRTKRAAILVFASLSLHLNRDDSSVFQVLPHLYDPTIIGVCDLLSNFMFASENASNSDSQFGALIRPIMVLINCEPRLLSAIFQEAANRIVGYEKHTDEAEAFSSDTLLLRALIKLIPSPGIVSVVRQESEQLKRNCQTIESHIANSGSSRNDHLGGNLRTRLDAIVGSS